MKTLKELVAAGEIDAAADIVYRSLLAGFNRVCPGIELTSEVLAAIAEKLEKKILGQEEPVEEYEGQKYETYEESENPGDDIKVKPAKAALTITYVCDDPDVEVPTQIVDVLAVGQDYSYASPEVEGYTPDYAVVEGKMTSDGVSVTVKYVETPEPSEEPVEYAAVTIIKDDTVKMTDAGEETKCVVENDKTAEVTAVIKEVKVDFQKKAEGTGPNKEASGWWVGAEVTPVSSKDENASVRLTEYDTVTVKKESEAEDGGKIKVYCALYPDKLGAPNGSDGTLTTTAEFDWNGDGLYEQKVVVSVDPFTVSLLLGEEEPKDVLWPKAK